MHLRLLKFLQSFDLLHIPLNEARVEQHCLALRRLLLALFVLCEVALAELACLRLSLFFLLAQELLVELSMIRGD